jgi:hypothetical protein
MEDMRYSQATRFDPDSYKRRLDDAVEDCYLALAARPILAALEPGLPERAQVAELMRSRMFSLSEAWRAVDIVNEEKAKQCLNP